MRERNHSDAQEWTNLMSQIVTSRMVRAARSQQAGQAV